MKKYWPVILGAFLLAVIVVFGALFVMDRPSPSSSDSTVALQEKAAPSVSSGNAQTDAVPVNGGIYLAIVILSCTTLLSVSITFYLYRWRKILLQKPNLLVPEEWGKYLNEVGNGLQKIGVNLERSTNSIVSSTSAIGEKTDVNTKKLAEMVETYLTLQGALDEKDKEIRRLKKGYDSEIYRKFIYRFIRVDQYLDELISEGAANTEMENVKKLLEDALEECGVERFSPEIGEDYRKASGVADNPKIKEAVSEEENFRIVEVIENGYRMVSGANAEIIIPAKVRIFQFKHQEVTA